MDCGTIEASPDSEGDSGSSCSVPPSGVGADDCHP